MRSSDKIRTTGSKIIELLPDDPKEACAEVLTAAAVVCLSAGFSDDSAARGLRAAMSAARELGVGEEHH